MIIINGHTIQIYDRWGYQLRENWKSIEEDIISTCHCVLNYESPNEMDLKMWW